MHNNTLKEIFRIHSGKPSDKWSSYITAYERLFLEFKNMPIRLLEIGVQNGGSLEIWSKYFTNGVAFVGCDIDNNCSKLSFKNSIISIIIGDANKPEISDKIFQHSSNFDIIIDDGSHLSSEIIKTFATYFPRLVDGGLYIVEDLHCSYWSQLEGGLFDPYSSMSFFKRLADIINYEHWGVPKSRPSIISGIVEKYDCEISNQILAQIHSVEFVNSMCIIRKAPAIHNSLGLRVISGGELPVVCDNQENNAIEYSLSPIYDQSNNKWSNSLIPPDEEFPQIENELKLSLDTIEELKNALLVNEAERLALNLIVTEKSSQIAKLEQIEYEFNNSTCWKLTAPIRFFGNKIKLLYKILIIPKTLLWNIKILPNILNKLANKSVDGIEYYTRILQSTENIEQISAARGLSKEFLVSLYVLGKIFLKLESFLNIHKLFNNYLENFSFINKTYAKRVDLNNIRTHVDKPAGFFKVIDENFTISGWSVDLKKGLAGIVRIKLRGLIHPHHAINRPDVHKVFSPICECPLSYELGFVSRPSVPVGIHRLSLEVFGQEGLWVTVFSIILFRTPWSKFDELAPTDYETWLKIDKKQLDDQLPEIVQHINVMIERPKFIIIVDTRKKSIAYVDTINSIKAQIYDAFEVYNLINESYNFNSSFINNILSLSEILSENKTKFFLVYLECGQILTPNALYEFANTINQYPDADLIYGDEDHLDENGERCLPFYKPDWSPDYLETFNYIGFTSCYRVSIINKFMEATCLYDLALRFTELTNKIFHVGKILGHNSEIIAVDKFSAINNAENLLALNGRLIRTGRDGSVQEHVSVPGCYDIELNLKNSPLVSIVIPTAGKIVNFEGRKIDLIVNIVSQVRKVSTYRSIEIIIVDNGDLSEIQFSSLVEMKCKFITFSEPIFNISKKLNLGASIAEGDFLLLLNDDIEILTSAWIERMLEHFEKSHVGVVGAKLLYPNGSIQHVGVVHNDGNPDHVRTLYPRNDAGYFYSTCGIRNYMAVTGAVMMTRASIFREVGGYSEELAVSYNDTDYCLKVLSKGFSILYNGKVELIHMESMSRVPSADPNEVRFYHERWASETYSDPFYNENFLNVSPSTFLPIINQRKL